MQKSRIALLSRNGNLHSQIGIHLESKGLRVVALPEPSRVLEFVYADPPDAILIDLSSADRAIQQVLRDLRQDSYFSDIPVIGLVGEQSVEDMQWSQFPLDDFASLPLNYRELFARIGLSLQRIKRVFDTNQLTKLPGTASIRHSIEQALGKPLAVCHADINNFKPYNDTFGFSRGDEVLRMVARIISNSVKESKEGGFVGHFGGDDFVFIVPLAAAEGVCKTVLDRFDLIASDLFVEQDKVRGYYIAMDRKGEVRKIPLLGISIGIVPADNPLMQHAGKVAEVAADLKKLAKKSTQSCYVIDRRRAKPIEECVLDISRELDDE